MKGKNKATSLRQSQAGDNGSGRPFSSLQNPAQARALRSGHAADFISSVAVEGEKVLIHDRQLGSESLIGKGAGDRIENPFWHGDGRDKIVRIEVLSVH